MNEKFTCIQSLGMPRSAIDQISQMHSQLLFDLTRLQKVQLALRRRIWRSGGNRQKSGAKLQK